MKRLWLSLLAIFCLNSSMVAQFIIGNSNTIQNLNDVYFMDTQTGVAVGDSGTIIRSVDGGLNWTTVAGIDSVTFVKVKFFNKSVGLAVGSSIYRSTDAGLTWQHVPHGNTEFTDVEITNNNTCLLAGKPNRVIQSTDLGQTFTTLVGDTASDNFGLLSFVNDTVGYSCGFYQGYSSKTLKTTNGGNSWTLIEDTVNGYNPTVMMAMSFITEDVGFKAGWYNPHLQITTDGANQWSNCPSPDSLFDPQLNDLHIEPNMQGHFYACGWYGYSYVSKDSGNTWTILDSGTYTAQRLNGIYFLDGARGWVVGSGGAVLKYETTIGLKENNERSKLSAYPNPSTGSLSILNAKTQDINFIQVYTLSGVFIEQITNSFKEIDLSSLENGMYILRISSQNHETFERWIKR